MTGPNQSIVNLSIVNSSWGLNHSIDNPSIDNSMRGRLLRVSLLLFGSGMTALIYQVAWMRELRLVFGISTAASAAVLAIFMGGLGAGGWILGRRADAATQPLAFYGRLELAVALSAALTPLWIFIVRQGYISVRGALLPGLADGTLARLLR